MDDTTLGDHGARGSRGIQSIEVGGQLLLALAHHGRPMALKDLARDAGMPPAKAHPYLVSFGKLGLVERDAASGHYGLGPLALQLGLISLQQFDPVRLATAVIDELAQAIGHTMAIAVWGNRGPTIVRVAPPPGAVHVAMRHGTVMSLTGTASGWLFAAWRPWAEVAPLLAIERAAAPMSDASLRRRLDEVRERRLARVVDASLPGVSALAAPVFDERGALLLSLTAIGPTAALDTGWDGAPAARLRDAADDLSRRLGGTPPQA
ncbi:IclR family transcriptional regulator [Azohydromonas sp.]|uniref:IclR family transcriptional regulator n=1 Tax=Azohydromonas sp. TaxID=1872666 RepID=UPI002BF159DE|nr:IclR family transcriptional regulator [Azohydromonas sp.]HMM84200.1 IclR family transcriptional regulator [Azohydromonas sp.]